MKTCSFTGHRRIESAHESKLSNLLSRAIKYAYDNGCRKFITGGAIGFDTLAAREVIKFRISHPDVSLVLALPCVNQDENWSLAQRDSYSYTLSMADEVVYVSEEYTDTCMRERNRYLAEECDMLIAYAARYASGAGQTVRMAKELGKQVYNLYSALTDGND